MITKRLIKKYESKDLNIAYNDGYEQANKNFEKILNNEIDYANKKRGWYTNLKIKAWTIKRLEKLKAKLLQSPSPQEQNPVIAEPVVSPDKGTNLADTKFKKKKTYRYMINNFVRTSRRSLRK